MIIRKLREADLSQLAAIENATQLVPWTDKIFKDCFYAGYPGWVMEEDGRVLGFTLLSLHGDECHLLNLAIHPQWQSQGYGAQLLVHAINAAKTLGAMMIYLEVRESNERAIALYKKLNFSQMGIRKDYYPAPEGRENALVYARVLDA